MKNGFSQRLKEYWSRAFNSIAFFPGLISFLFFIAAFLLLEFDDSLVGRDIKLSWRWLRLHDANTARTIISAVITGMITLTVFSFTMVMVILNQAASNMSNRVLDHLIKNRFQQVVLGVYMGTIVFALLLLASIKDADEGISVPIISTYFLMGTTMANLFLFIYFLDFVTQSVRYKTIIHRIADATMEAMKESCRLNSPGVEDFPEGGLALVPRKAGIYQGVERDRLVKICNKYKVVLSFPLPPGTFVLPGSPVCRVHNTDKISEELYEAIIDNIKVYALQSISENYLYGLKQLTEVAVKALSPGINDPGTAIEALHSLGKLLEYRHNHYPESAVRDMGNKVVLYIRELTFQEILKVNILPIWDYGKEDRMLNEALMRLLEQLYIHVKDPHILTLMTKLQQQMEKQMQLT